MSTHNVLRQIEKAVDTETYLPLGTGGAVIFTNAGAPTSGTSGTGVNHAGKGSVCLDTTNGKIYTNSGSITSPTWAADSAALVFTADTGGLAANDYAYVSGWDSTNSRPKLKKAQANDATTCEDLYYVPSAVTAAAAGLAYKSATYTSALTNSGSVGAPVYLSASSAGAATATLPTGTNVVKKVGSFATTGATAVVNVELGGETIPIHTHADNSQGGALTTPALTGTTNTSFLVASGAATPEFYIDASAATGDFRYTSVVPTIAGNVSNTFPTGTGQYYALTDQAAGTIVNTAVATTTATSLTIANGAATPELKFDASSATGDFRYTVTVPTIGSNTANTLPTGTAQYFALTSNSDGTVTTTASTGTTASTFTVDSDAVLGKMILSVTAGGVDKSLTLTNAALTSDRVITFPNDTGTVALLGTAQTFSAANVFSSTVDLRGNVTASTGNPAINFGGSNGAFTTSTGTNTLSGEVTIASGKDITFAGGDSAFDASSGTGAFKTSQGTNTFYGNLTNNGNITFDFSGSNGIFKTSTGTNTLGGNVVITGASTLTTGTGAATLKGSATFDATKTLTFGAAAGGTATPITMYSATANKGGLILAVADAATDHATTLTNAALDGAAATITLPNATSTLSGLSLAETFSGIKTFTAVPVISIADATTDAVTDVLTISKTVTGAGAGGAGMGLGLAFQLEDATSNEEKASLDIVQTDATQATSDVDFVFSQNINGTITETFRIDADGGVKIGKTGGSALLPTLTIYSPTTTLGSFKITCADATGGDYALTLTNASQTTGSATVTIPDCAGAAKNLAFGDSAGAVAVANLAAAVQDLIPTATITAAAEAGHARTITVQVKDAAGNNLTEFFRMRMWVAAAGDYAVPGATGTDTFGAPSAGAIFETITAKADYEILTDTDGKYVFDLTHNDAGSNRYVMVDIGGRVYSSGALAFDAV